MRQDTIFIKHHNFNIKEDDKFLNIFFNNKLSGEKEIEILKEKNPDSEYELVYVGNDVNDLAMRIVSFCEKFCLPQYKIIMNGKPLYKTYYYDDVTKETMEELREANPNAKLKVIQIQERHPFPKYVCLEQCDYNLLKRSGKINLENNTTFGIEIKINRPKYRRGR